MATEILDARAPDRVPLVERAGGPGGQPPLGHGDDGGGPGASFDPAQFGVWAFLGTVTMLFIGFTSAYIVRRTGIDWRPLPLPRLLWWNTAALLMSSAALEVARRRRAALDRSGLRAWLGATALLAAVFVAGQFQAWRLLRALGFFLSSNPHSSFFYMLSGVHLFHLGGGLVWFALVLYRLRGPRYAAAGGGRTLSLFATYWHFLGLLWVYVLVLIFVF
ncbi:MAG TPA: cytochrome c oxidase subunit 3 [Vicinamibacteria bacterium]|jgi:cytochrome c oxidase subunit 3